jgi:hypothetical protein
MSPEVRENHTGLKNRQIKYHQQLEDIKDSKTRFFFLFGAVSDFSSLIIKGFVFSGLNTTLWPFHPDL